MTYLSNWENFTQADFKEMLDCRQLKTVLLNLEGSLILTWSSGPMYYGELKYTSDMPAYHELLELFGPLTVNSPKNLYRKVPNEEFISPEYFEAMIFQCGTFNRAEILPDECVDVFVAVFTENQPREKVSFRGANYIQVLEKHLGPLKAGDIIDFVTPMPTDELEECFKKGMFSKVKMHDDGSIWVWYSNTKGLVNADHFECPPGSPHIPMLEKYFGPIRPGDVFEIPPEELENTST